MKFNRNHLKTPWVAYTIATCSAVFLYVCLTHFNVFAGALRKIAVFISPVFLAAVFAYILNPLTAVFEKYVFSKVRSAHMRRTLSVTFTVIAVLLFIAILLIALIPQLVQSVVTFIGNIDGYVVSLQSLLNNLGNSDNVKNSALSELISSGGNLLDTIRSKLPESFNNIINTSINFTKGIIEAVIAFILAIYFLAAKDTFKHGFKFLLQAILSDRIYPTVEDFLRKCNNILIRYIIYDLLDGLIIGISNMVFMVIAGMPYGVLLSVVVGVTNLAPTFGPIVGGAIGAFILVLVNPWYALGFLIFTVILQTFDGYILKPKLFGGSLGVPPVWVLISIIVGGRIFGIIGVLLAIPFAAIVDYIYESWILIRLKRRRDRHRQHCKKSEETSDTASGEQGETEETAAKDTDTDCSN